MKNKQYFWVNQRMEIAPLDQERYYKTYLWDVYPETFHIALPMLQRRPFLPEKGSQVKARFTLGDALYTFQTIVTGRIDTGKLPLFVLRKPARLFRQQRRSYCREQAFLKMEYLLMGGEENLVSADAETETVVKMWVRASALDISASGIKFTTDKKLDEGTELRLRFYISRKNDLQPELIEADGRVVRAAPPGMGAQRHTYGLEFVSLKEGQREKIVNFIFTLPRRKVR
jgi:c-di-GMP-binding flagellar brake protein YcgR